jgi:Zn-dependent peptidase ImmA (M78 family)
MFPQLTYWPNYRAIKAKAHAILRDAGVTHPPVPIREIIETHGVDVVFVKLGTLGDQVAGLTKFDEAKIYVNADDVFVRQTFTMAHEFGHWVLHRNLFLKEPDRYKVLLRRQTTARGTQDPLEKEANAFAGNILVPEFLLKPVKDVAGPTELARMFAVSQETIGHRLKYV